MVNDIEEHFVNRPEEFVKLLKDAESPLFPTSKVTKLSFLVRLFNMKSRNSWSDSNFSQLRGFLGEILPDNNSIPSSTYDEKK